MIWRETSGSVLHFSQSWFSIILTWTAVLVHATKCRAELETIV